MKHDHTLGKNEYTTLITQKTRTTSCPQYDNTATYLSMCDTKDTLCDESDNTRVTLHKTLGMSVKYVYITSRKHKIQIYLVKQAKNPLYMISDTSHAKRQHFLYEEKSASDSCDM